MPKQKTILRKGYSYMRNGKRVVVPATRIKDQGPRGRLSTYTKRKKTTMRKRKEKHKGVNYSGKGFSCKKGSIKRKGYVARRKRKVVKVGATCIKDRGSRGKGPQLIGSYALKQVDLAPYTLRLDVHKRHRALDRAVGKYGALSVFRKLNALYVLNKSRKRIALKFYRDRNWVRDVYRIGKRKR